jgi:hypothetical protein
MHNNRSGSITNIYISFSRDVNNSDSIDYGPNPTYNDGRENELQNAVANASAHVVLPRASIDHSADAWQKDVQYETDPCKTHPCGVDVLSRTHSSKRKFNLNIMAHTYF